MPIARDLPRDSCRSYGAWRKVGRRYYY
jgi:hypothetical protein